MKCNPAWHSGRSHLGIAVVLISCTFHLWGLPTQRKATNSKQPSLALWPYPSWDSCGPALMHTSMNFQNKGDLNVNLLRETTLPLGPASFLDSPDATRLLA